jgi:hypothetical protein
VTLEWEVKRIGVSHDGSRGSETPEEARHG